MKPESSIAVIGAGLAGLSCARRLQLAGHRVRVFEKSRGSGGRLSTKRGEQPSGAAWQCDIGAQYFTARSPAFRAEVRRWEDAGLVAEWHPRLAVFGSPPGRPDTADSEPVIRYTGQPRMTAPARWLADALTLETQTTIQAIQREAAGWRIRSAEQGWLAETFDAVVLAVPAPQAVPLLQPVNPGLAELAASVRMRGSWALVVHYAQALELGFDAAFVNDGPLRWVACDRHKPKRSGQTCWLLHAQADWSDAHIEASPQTIADALLAAFAKLGAPPPASWLAHRWRYADTAQPLTMGAVWLASEGLGLCGDWLQGGRVEGAWLSGQALAERIVS